MARFEVTATIPAAIEAVFDFLITPQNLIVTAPPGVTLTFLKPPPDRLQLGTKLEIEFHGMGPTQQVIYETTEFNAPHSFMETQCKGPLQKLVHTRQLQVIGPTATLLTDTIEFEPPGGLLGLLVSEDMVRKLLEQGIVHRHQEIRRLLGTPS